MRQGEHERARTRGEVRPDYGVDGYPYLAAMLGGGSLALLSGGLGLAVGRAPALRAAAAVACAVGALALAPGLLGLRYVRTGKLRHRDRILDRLSFRGDEQVLDVGTGGGLLMIGAAKRVPRGKAFGVDIWKPGDLSGNTRERVLRNAEIEGVLERVEVRSEDARKMSFADETFDVVVSILCLHNIEGAAQREVALTEIVRVLKKGGVLLVSDLAHTDDYAETLRSKGLDVTSTAALLDTFPFQRLVQAKKAG